MSLKCCWSVAYYIETLSYRDTLYILYICLDVYVLVSIHLIYVISFAIIIFINIAINHIVLLIKKNLCFEHVCQKFGLRLLLSFCLIFCIFQRGVAYKSVAYIKKSIYTFCYSTQDMWFIFLPFVLSACCAVEAIFVININWCWEQMQKPSSLLETSSGRTFYRVGSINKDLIWSHLSTPFSISISAYNIRNNL